MRSVNREDYLISILRLTEGERSTKTTELATFMGVSPASVTEMIKILASEGLVAYERYHGATLTENGLKYARNVRKKHHILETFLTDVLDLSHEQAHDEACHMEHAISDECMLKLCKMIGSPVDTDCKSCYRPCKAASSNRSIESINDMCAGERGIVSHLRNDDPAMVMKLLSLGFVPGREVYLSVKSSNGPRIVEMDGSATAIDSVKAASIFVDL